MAFEKRELDSSCEKWDDYSEYLAWMYKAIADDLNARHEVKLGGYKQYGNVMSVNTKQGLRNYIASHGYNGKL